MACSIKFKNFKVLFQARNKFTTTSDLIINWINPFYVLGFKKVVLFGYSYTSYLFILFVRSALGKKTYLFNETTLSDKKENLIKKKIKEILLSFFSKIIVPGSESAKYLQHHNVSKSKIYFAENATHFSNTNKKIKPNLKKMLFVGRLAPEKRIVEFTKIFLEHDYDLTLTIVGDGADKKQLKKLQIENPEKIILLSSQDSDSLKNIYESHDCLVLPSKVNQGSC